MSFAKFFAVRFPIAVIVILATCQLAAIALSGVPLRRQRTDDLPLAVELDKTPHRTLLIGDSITRNATRRYNVGSDSQVLNLSSNVLIGLPGSDLVLRRYLATHPPMQYLVIAATPNMYDSVKEPPLYHYYLWNVFKRPEERKFLQALIPAIDSRGWLPAAFDLQQRILEPALSLFARGLPSLEPAGQDPDPSTPLEPDSMNVATMEVLDERMQESTDLQKPQAEVLRDLCALSLRYGFKIDFVWPPSPKPVVDYWRSKGSITKLQDEIADALGDGCRHVRFTDLNDQTSWTVFDHVGYHLRGDGWEQRFAGELKQHIADLPSVNSGSKASEPPVHPAGLTLR